MRWLLIGLLISVGALLFVAGAVTRHVLRQRRMQAEESSGKVAELEPGLDLPEESEMNQPPADDGPNKRDHDTRN